MQNDRITRLLFFEKKVGERYQVLSLRFLIKNACESHGVHGSQAFCRLAIMDIDKRDITS